MAVIGNIVANLGINSSAWTSGLKTGQQQAGIFRKGIDAMSVAAGIAIDRLASKIVSFGSDMIEAASDAQEARSKFDTVFGGLAGDAEQWANRLADSVGRSRNDMIAFAASLQDTFKPLGFAADEAFELTKQVQQLGIDLASFQNLSDEEGINRLIGGLIGNHENLRSFGVIINETTLKAKLLEMGFQSATKQATEQEKVLARLALIMEGTTDAQGDAERTAGSYANMLKRVQGVIKDLKIEIGQQILEPLAVGLERSIPLLKEYGTAAASVLTTLVEIGTASGTDVPEGLDKTVSSAEWAVKGVGMIGDAWQGFRAIFAYVQSGVTKGLSMWIGMIGAIVRQIETLANMIPGIEVNVSETMATISEDLNKLAAEQWSDADKIVDEKLLSEKLLENFRKAKAEAAKATEENATEVISTGIKQQLDGIVATAQEQWAGVTGWIGKAYAGLQEEAGEAMSANAEKPGGPSTIRKNSREYFEYAAGLNGGNKEAVDVAKEQLAEQKNTNKLLADVVNGAAPTVVRFLGLT